MNGFFSALSFLTRRPGPVSRNRPAAGVSYFPLVGLLLGALGTVSYLLRRAFPVGPLPIVAARALNHLLSGGLHADGLMDTADSLGAGDPERPDDRLGTTAELAEVLALVRS